MSATDQLTNTIQDGTYSYITRRECGCICSACVDTASYKKETAKFVAKAVRLGDAVERILTEDVRTASWGCEKCR